MNAERPAAHVLRLFVAVEVPDAAKRAVSTAIEPWRELLPNARWIPPESWHVTLKFLGGAEGGRRAWIEETIGAVALSHTPLEARMANLGAFPNAGRARVLWAGLEASKDGLDSLAADLEAGLAEEFSVEARPFRPHLTVARSEPPARLPEGFAETEVSAGPFLVDRLVLFQSHLRRPHPRYEALRLFALGR